MIRHFYLTENLAELVAVEHELEQQGISEFQIHVLSEHDAELTEYDLPQVESILKKDLIHSTEIGAVIGVLAGAIILLLAYIQGWTRSEAGWLPFALLAVIVTGFCTWEGGFIGIQSPNVNFKRFNEVISRGKHLLFVDIEPKQEVSLSKVINAHPKLIDAGTGASMPKWVIKSQHMFRRFVKTMP